MITDDGEQIFIAERNSLHALNGDTVEVYVYAKRRNSETEGEVTAILKRSEQVFIGVLCVQKQYAFLITDDKTLANDIFIPKNKLHGGKNGEKAIVRISEWPAEAKNPLGEVIDVLGEAGKNDTEMHAILAEFGLPYHYPENVEKAADAIPDEIPADEIARREDFRSVTTFTIDPRDAKDFDDAYLYANSPQGDGKLAYTSPMLRTTSNPVVSSTKRPKNVLPRSTWSTGRCPCCPKGFATTYALCGLMKIN